jgi:predicted metal-dependent peptidase
MKANLLNNSIFNDVQFFVRKFDSILYTFLNELVEPVFSKKIPTAAVAFSRKDAAVCIQFLFNKEFWESLNYNEKNFVFTHEVSHVIFRHGIRGQQYLNSLSKEQRNFELLNICQDICINHIIVDQYMKDIPFSAMPLLKGLCFVETVFEKEHHHLIKKGESFQYYYERYIELYGLDKMPKNVRLLDVHGVGEDGVPIDEAELTDEELEELEEIFEEIEKSIAESNSTIDELEQELAGKSFSINDEYFSDKKKTKEIEKGKSLDELFKVVIKKAFAIKYDITKKSNWFGFNRRTSGALAKISPDLTLPVTAEKRKEIPKRHKVLVYLDVSGSCKSYSEKFMMLVAALPEDKYEAHINVFADRVSEVKVSKTKEKKVFNYSYAGAGTNINSVIMHARKKMENNHFDAVFVLTDGHYSDINSNTINDYSNWYFFMTPSHKRNVPNKASVFKISRL